MDIPSYLREVVTVLARDIGYRPYSEPERMKRAADFIAGQFSAAGYDVARQPVPYRGQEYQNVIAELTGAVSPERILVIGAHYDTVRTTPGADDNASGIAGLLCLARLLSDEPLAKTVRFVAFALEEPPAFRTRNMGSYQYAQGLSEQGAQVEGMVCLEMIGYFCDTPGCQHYPLPLFQFVFSRTGDYIAMVGNVRSRGFTQAMAAAFRESADLPLVTLNAPSLVLGIDFSDHWAFAKLGYPALMVTDTAFFRNPHYHSPTDLPETLDYERMAKVVAGVRAAVETWAAG